MNKIVIGALAFVGGFVAGSLVSKSYFKKKYERIADEEIASVKETFKKKDDAPAETKKSDLEELVERVLEEDKKAYESKEVKKIIADNGYDQETKEIPEKTVPIKKVTKSRRKKADESGAYIISPDEFGDCDYERIDLTYYADGVLADDENEMIDDPEELVGPVALHSFGEYMEDVIHVRSDKRKCDYEITTDPRNWKDVYQG